MPNNPETVPPEKQLVASDSVRVTTESPGGGAIYHALHVSRTVKTYPIQEHELSALDDLGRNSTLWTAIGSASLALLASCVWDMLHASTPASDGEKGFMVLLAVVSIASFWMGGAYGRRRKSRLEKIMSECDR